MKRSIFLLPVGILLISLISFFSVAPMAQGIGLGYGYGEEDDDCDVTAPRAFRKSGRTPLAIRFVWKRAKQLCNRKVDHYTIVVRKVKRGHGKFTKAVPATARMAIIRSAALAGPGQYQAHVFAAFKNATRTPNSDAVRFKL
ncbi:MAG: hypothetical protein HYV33_03660 [Candidatus Kerfeldbacteria bacterium]|nr:hypothetical protein [Candidatus Kerfeldbacteria bacterium]